MNRTIVPVTMVTPVTTGQLVISISKTRLMSARDAVALTIQSIIQTEVTSVAGVTGVAGVASVAGVTGVVSDANQVLLLSNIVWGYENDYV